MKRAIKGAKFESGPNMTPLVDIVMVLLVFIMLVARLITDDTHLLYTRVPLSQQGAGGAQVINPGELPKVTLELLVDPVGSGYVARVASNLDLRATNREQMTNILRGLKAGFQSRGQDINKDVIVQISPRASVRFANLIEIFDAANEVGFESVGFAAARP